MRDPKFRLVRAVLAISFSITFLLGLIVMVRGSRLGLAVAIGLAVAFVAIVAVADQMQKRGKPVTWVLAFASLNLFLVAPEMALRAMNFRHESGIQFGYERPSDFIRYVPDETLFWKMDPQDPHVNSWGFPGREIGPKPSKDTKRILFLGDSVVHQGFPAYVAQLLNVRHSGSADGPQMKFESISLAMSGYSTHQGQVVANKFGKKVDPDFVVVSYGWNDHWRAMGSVDSEKVVKVSRSAIARAFTALSRIRLVQLMLWMGDQLRGGPPEPLKEVRVPLPQYEKNLRAIRDAFPGDVPVLFITAPTSHYSLGVPSYLVESNLVESREALPPLHRSYVEVSRKVTADHPGTLIDLERQFSGVDNADLETIFMKDGIHLTPLGLATVADQVANGIEQVLH